MNILEFILTCIINLTTIENIIHFTLHTLVHNRKKGSLTNYKKK